MDSFEASFQLQNTKQDPSKNPIVARIAVGSEEINVTLNLFFDCSNFFSKNTKTDSNPEDLFIASYCEAVKKLKVKDENSKLFLNIINGKQTKIKSTNFFDLFKLSKHFSIDELLTFLQKTCQMINDTKVIYSVLQKGKISKEEIEYFIRFLSCGQMKEKLGEKINECFELYFFTPEFPSNAIFVILECCKSIDSVTTNKLYELIIQSFDRNFRLIPFLDFYRLNENQKTSFRKSFHDYIKKIKQWKIQADENDAKQSPNYLLENQLHLNEIKMNEMQRKIDDLQNENEQLKKKIDQNKNKESSIVSSKDSFEMEKKIDDLQTENEQLKKKIEESTVNTNLKESSKITELQTENGQLKDKLDKISTKYKTYKLKLNSLASENEQLKKKNDTNMSKAASAVSSKDSFEMEKKIDDLQTENEQLKKKIEESAVDTNFRESPHFKDESKIASLQTENDQLKDELDKIQTKYKQQCKTLINENDQLKMNQQKLCDGLDELTSNFDILKQNYSLLLAENKQLKNQRDNEDKPIHSHPVKQKLSGKDQTDESNAHPHLTQKNYDRIKIFNENKDIVAKGYYKISLYGQLNNIKNDFDYSIENTKLISANEQLIYDAKRKKCKQIDKSRIYSKIEVTKESTFAAAIRNKIVYKKLCVLNFASATKPGGGVLNGRNAQEESLARQSTLYFSLVKQNKFYDYNNEHYDSFGTDYMIYSPNIIILRDDNDKLIDPIKVSVISSVAVNYSELQNHDANLDQKVYDIMKNRCRRILELCLAKGNEAIILGAFGCGVFKNPPKIISKIFKELLIDEAIGMEFKKVVFAILTKPNSSDELYKVFSNAFKLKIK